MWVETHCKTSTPQVYKAIRTQMALYRVDHGLPQGPASGEEHFSDHQNLAGRTCVNGFRRKTKADHRARKDTGNQNRQRQIGRDLIGVGNPLVLKRRILALDHQIRRHQTPCRQIRYRHLYGMVGLGQPSGEHSSILDLPTRPFALNDNCEAIQHAMHNTRRS